MKTISTLLAALILSSSVFADASRPTASLTVKSSSKSDIVVVVDDKKYDLGTNAIMISDLEPCEHEVTILQENVTNPVNYYDRAYDEIFEGPVTLKPRTTLEIAINQCGTVSMSEITSKRPLFGDTWKGEYYFDHANLVNAPTYSNAISNYDFSRVLWAIGKESSESNRMLSAEQIIRTNYVTVYQLSQLMQLFCSDASKLEIAKLAYPKTVDQDDYYVLNNIFKDDDARSEFAQCIRH